MVKTGKLSNAKDGGAVFLKEMVGKSPVYACNDVLEEP